MYKVAHGHLPRCTAIRLQSTAANPSPGRYIDCTLHLKHGQKFLQEMGTATVPQAPLEPENVELVGGKCSSTAP